MNPSGNQRHIARQRRLLEGPIAPALAALAIPNVAIVTAQSLATVADAYFIGQLGVVELAAVALAFPVQALLGMLSQGAIGGGISSAVARALGAGDQARAEALIIHALLIAVVLSVIYTLLFAVLARPTFAFLGGQGEALDGTVAYAQVLFGRNRPGRGAVHYAAWIWLWPSLWFWPSSIGKESVTVLAIGLVVFGYGGHGRRIRWGIYLSGLALAFALRPHVGATLALATAAAYWFQSWSRPGFRRVLESIVAVVLALFLISAMAAQFGLETADLEGVQEFVQYRTVQTMEGGSRIGDSGQGLTAVLMAFVNIWMRPFPWDVHNLMALFSAIEIIFLWALAVSRYKAVGLAIKHWRGDRLLVFALPLLAGYTLMIGLTFANLGIIARQRTPLFPFVFMLLTAAGAYGTVRAFRQEQRQASGPRPEIRATPQRGVP